VDSALEVLPEVTVVALLEMLSLEDSVAAPLEMLSLEDSAAAPLEMLSPEDSAAAPLEMQDITPLLEILESDLPEMGLLMEEMQEEKYSVTFTFMLPQMNPLTNKAKS